MILNPMTRLMRRSILIVALSLISVFFAQKLHAQNLNVAVKPNRAAAGDTVQVIIKVKKDVLPTAYILIPGKDGEKLKLRKENSSSYIARYIVEKRSPQGLYAVHCWTGDSLKPSSIGKASFLFKKIIGDFCMVGIFDPHELNKDIENYLDQFESMGGNFLIIHGIINSTKVYYESKICNTDSTTKEEQSFLGTLLTQCDRRGIPVLLSTSWDMTREIPATERTKSTEEIMHELYKLYGYHPSVTGFYAYQEGSGLNYLPFIREFCGYAKHLDGGLLTGTAPYMNNALLAGYLGTVKDLDIIIYQSMVMASYRPDNRLKFPARRVKDFGSICSGAKKLQNKIALTHVELFGYGENRLEKLYITGYDNIYQQILSAATVPENDGITLFTYNYVIYNQLKTHKEFERSKQAVEDGLKAFKLIGQASNESNEITVYYPWTDFQVNRWACYYYHALDAFRTLGMPVDILDYTPPLDEAYPPYYPFHENPDAVKRLLKNKKFLVFPNVSGMYQTDSDMLKHFLSEGGTVIAFGPHIPTGTTYDRSQIFGIEKTGKEATHSQIISKEYFNQNNLKNEIRLLTKTKLPVWKSTGAKVAAEFEDGSPAITINDYGKGRTISILTDIMTAAKQFPGFIRALFDDIGAKRYMDIIGTNKNTDIAVSKTSGGCTTAIVNHNDAKLEVTLKPINQFEKKSREKWIDLVTEQTIKESQPGSSLKITVLPKEYRLIKMEFVK